MSDKRYKGLVKSLKKYKIGSDRRYYVGLEIAESESLRLVTGVMCQFNIGGKIINCPVCECLLNDDDTVNGVSFIFEDPKNELNWLETIDINLCNSYLYFNVGHDTKKAKEVLDTMVANTDDKIYRKYTKQELWLAYTSAASTEWVNFNDFFEKTFADKPATQPFDIELEKHEYMNRQVDKVMEQYKEEEKKPVIEGRWSGDSHEYAGSAYFQDITVTDKVKQSPNLPPSVKSQAVTDMADRESFLIHLDAALRICEVPLTVGQVEKAVKIYNTVKEHGGQTSIEYLLR
jgi:hypothetical protein